MAESIHKLLAEYTGILQTSGSGSFAANSYLAKRIDNQRFQELAAVVNALWEALRPLREDYQRRNPGHGG